jgi:Malic enzyme
LRRALDYPNQVNNVLCFPFLFRGALDVGATTINEAMKSAAVRAIASLAHAELSDVVATAYGDQRLQFGPDYLIPTPFDPRLIERIAPAVAKAAMESGVASRPLADLEAYRQTMARFMYQSGASMEPVFAAAKVAQKQIALAEGEDDRVLRAAQLIVEESLGRPVLVGRPESSIPASSPWGCAWRTVATAKSSVLKTIAGMRKAGASIMTSCAAAA